MNYSKYRLICNMLPKIAFLYQTVEDVKNAIRKRNATRSQLYINILHSSVLRGILTIAKVKRFLRKKNKNLK